MLRFDVDLDQSPLLVIWEVTRACALACKHCRADAINQRHPGELSTEGGKKLLEELAAMGTPVVVFTGGDPLQRPDLLELIRHAKAQGLRVGTIPAATARLTREVVQDLAAVGLDQMALSLDASTAAQHDDLRQVPGSFDLVMNGARWARELGLPLQINSVLGQWNYEDFDALSALVQDLGVVFWEVFFLVPTGRGEMLKSCTATQFETLFAKLYALQQDAEFVIKVTEAPHYRRYCAQRGGTAGHPASGRMPGRGLTVTRGGINAGKGFAFVDHVGTVYPSGFLPIDCGNLRHRTFTEIYREDPLFLALRDPSQLKGVCGTCRYKDLCGGSRARAYAMTGDAFAEEPFCVLVENASLRPGS